MNEEGYPKHDEKFFAFKVIKALIQSGDNLVIGSNATSLVNLIAVAEDHFHYSRPIRFHRQQLMEQLGFRSGKQLDVARQKDLLLVDDSGTRSRHSFRKRKESKRHSFRRSFRKRKE
ncbi:MAG: hypothetical protein EB060_11015 [Proteobacteria bacterium]|nr:hypothetical protein [Pseudomonadota bacterium]